MAEPTLEQRVAALEREVAELRDQLKNGSGPKDWQSTFGMFTGSESMKRIDEQKARDKQKKAQRTKK
jgi:hypothetical protein